MSPQNEPVVICPNCRSEIKLTDAMALPLVEAERKKMADHFDAEKQVIESTARTRALADVETVVKAKDAEVQRARETLRINNEKLQIAQDAQAKAVEKERDLDNQKRELGLTVQKLVSEKVATIRDNARAEVQAELGGELSEKNLLLSRMRDELADLKKKVEQGSQQAQGEVLELEIEEELRKVFLFDRIEPVPKGQFGGDVLQRVSENQKEVGTIIWEIKRTKNWSEGWLAKLRGDQRAAKAEIAIIVTVAIPDDLQLFGMREGIWITTPQYALALAACLRTGLCEVYAARNANAGQETKAVRLYQYMSGPEFRQRIAASIEHFVSMQKDLETERRAADKNFARREMQIRGAIKALAGMHGDVQGIAGESIADLPSMEIPQIEGGK